MKRFGQVAAAMGIWALSLTTGCGNFWVYPGSETGGGTNSGDYVYVANATTGTLAGYLVGTATLTAVSGSPYPLGFVPTSVVVNPANTIVFVSGTNGTDGFVDAYSIGTGGVLSLLMSNNLGSAGEVSIDVSPDGKWLVGLDSAGAQINEVILDEYQITASTGQLTLQAQTSTNGTYTYSSSSGPSIPTIVPEQAKFAPSGAYVFVAAGTAGELVFPFSSGVFSAPNVLDLGAGATVSDNALAVNSSSSYLYVARSGSSGGLAVFTIGSGGALNQVTVPPLTAGTDPTSVVVNKAGTDIYVANQATGSISEYSLASNGTVAALSPASVTTTSVPYALAVDNSGNYLLTVSRAGNPDLAMYSYSSGQLTVATSTATGTGSNGEGAVALATTH
jgi:6-phosphogluconolactonase (cycloisomerase 2 family)